MEQTAPFLPFHFFLTITHFEVGSNSTASQTIQYGSPPRNGRPTLGEANNKSTVVKRLLGRRRRRRCAMGHRLSRLLNPEKLKKVTIWPCSAWPFAKVPAAKAWPTAANVLCGAACGAQRYSTLLVIDVWAWYTVEACALFALYFSTARVSEKKKKKLATE